MKSISIFLIATVFVLPVMAQNHHGHKHDHKAHQHGAGKLAIAFEGTKGEIEFEAAAVGVLGFEHKAKSEKDKKTLADAITLFETKISDMVKFDPALNCQFKKEKVELDSHGKHGDFEAEFQVTCDKSPEGTTIIVDFSAVKGLSDVDVTVLVGAVQKSAEYKSSDKKTAVQIPLK